ncbi:MAG: bifunctional folylpolyglutamate synthase/dihydrofolate synthase [Candidatus Omnitrophica bacterium]|nr:bifunctional folylpolyglutamate synthase/dihydrofolate synthase [Candidatus Omnitrophota bacterium]
MTYPEVIQYLASFINYEKIVDYPYKESLKLERIREFLNIIGNPQASLKCIHVCGTKGKGSTCAFIAYILGACGFRVGLYTSPHLVDFRERIRILAPEGIGLETGDDFAGIISEEDLTQHIHKLRSKIDSYNRSSQYGPLSFFEVYTALAFDYFKAKKVDFAVLETGLGGRLDATNAADALVCAITPISYEHAQKLGNTLAEITAEKSGIIKNSKQVVVSAAQEKEAQQVIRQRASAIGCRLYEVGRDILYEGSRESFNVIAPFSEYPLLKIQLIGRHQLMNASVAVAVVDCLRLFGVYVGISSVRSGLGRARWPGRCEVIAEKPLIVLDGAQNIASAKAIKEAIRQNFHYSRLILLFGISQDKDIEGVCNELSQLADIVILTKADNPRAARPEELAAYFQDKPAYITRSIKEAKSNLQAIAREDDLVLVTGSLFVVGEFRHVQI